MPIEQILCKKTFISYNIEYYTAGHKYDIVQKQNNIAAIKTNQNTFGYVGKGFMIENIDEYFETNNLTIMTKALSFNPANIDMLDTVEMHLQIIRNPINQNDLGYIYYMIPAEIARLIHNTYYKSKYRDIDHINNNATDAERMNIYRIAERYNMIVEDCILECY